MAPAQTLEALRATEARLRAIVETAPVGLARIARDGKVLAANAAVLSMIGASKLSEIVGKPVFTMVQGADRVNCQEFIKRVCARQPGSLEFTLVTLSGASLPVEASAVPLDADSGAAADALVVLRDSTSRAERQRNVQTVNALKQELVRELQKSAEYEHLLQQTRAELHQLADKLKDALGK
jgi:PAS domain S-box-containing protein